MTRLCAASVCMLAVAVFSGRAQPKSTSLVDFEMMTWPEVKHALEQGKTTILIYNGGTEQRGPQNVNGGHTLMGHATVVAIAEKLGNAIAAPVLPYSVNNASAALPGTIGITGPLFEEINEQVAEQMIINGFKSVVFMGDHGGGQKELADLANKLSEKHAAQGIKVVYCGDVYQKANDDFDKYLTANNLPVSSHAGIPDTSEMMYLGSDKGWVRKDEIPNALGRPPRKRGDPPPGPNAPRPVNNGIQGDARQSTPELGKKLFDMKVDYAVTQIHELLK
jgi:creatinine amidohydrolase